MKLAKGKKLKSQRSQSPDSSRENSRYANNAFDSLKSCHVTEMGGNVFVDLGFSPDEARRLKAESAQRIDVAQA